MIELAYLPLSFLAGTIIFKANTDEMNDQRYQIGITIAKKIARSIYAGIGLFFLHPILLCLGLLAGLAPMPRYLDLTFPIILIIIVSSQPILLAASLIFYILAGTEYRIEEKKSSKKGKTL